MFSECIKDIADDFVESLIKIGSYFFPLPLKIMYLLWGTITIVMFVVILCSGMGHYPHRPRLHTKSFRVLCYLTMVLLFPVILIGAAYANPQLENIIIKKGELQICFTGHTFPLMVSDQQFYLADQIRQQNCEFTVLGGDVVVGKQYNGLFFSHSRWNRSIIEEQWEKFDLFRSRLGETVIFLPGDHDLLPETEQYVEERVGTSSLYSSHKLQSSLFVFLNTVKGTAKLYGGSGWARLDDKQMAWLADLLRDTAENNLVFLFMHHQLWEKDNRQFDKQIRPLLLKFRSVYLFAGNSGVYSKPIHEGNLHYYAMSNMLNHLGFYLIDINLLAKTVRVTTKRNGTNESAEHLASRVEEKRVSEIISKIKDLPLSKKFWLGILLGACAPLILYFLKRS